MSALKFSGPVLGEQGEEVRDLYVVDGRVTFEPQPGAETAGRGWIVPGLVDAHNHLGLERAPHRSPIPLDLALVFVARRSHSSTFRQRSLHEGRRTFLLFLGVGLARSRAGSGLLRGQIDCE